ncbi:MAG TPA: MATE family efflux transporter, partial [Syntrophomonadaceae bacterium]|nr:MATE family efflux transporter [Syntrophomonadaceae bacterium]
IGTSIMVAQLFGAKEYEKLSLAVTTNLLTALGLSVILTVLGEWCASPLLSLLNTPKDVFPQALIYVQIIFGGLVFTVFYNQISGLLRGMGNSKTPLYFLIFCSLVNLLLDYIFVKYFLWGISGAAIATVVAQAISSVMCLFYIFRRVPILNFTRHGPFFDYALFKKTLILGIPSGIQQASIAVGLLVMQAIINSFDTNVISAFTASSRIDMFAVMPLVATGSALSVYAGQNIGARQLSRVRQGYHTANFIIITISAVLAAIVVPARVGLLNLFVDGQINQAVVNIGAQYLTILPLFYVLLGFTNSTYGILNGAGDATFVMISTVAMMGIRAIVAYILAFSCGFGYVGIWWSWPISWLFVLLMTLWRYHSGAWKQKLIIVSDKVSAA